MLKVGVAGKWERACEETLSSRNQERMLPPMLSAVCPGSLLHWKGIQTGGFESSRQRNFPQFFKSLLEDFPPGRFQISLKGPYN